MAFQRNGTSTAVLVVDTKALGSGALLRIDPVSGQQSTVSSGDLFDAPIGIAIAADGTVLVADLGPEGPDPGCVLRVDPASGVQERVSSGGMLRSRSVSPSSTATPFWWRTPSRFSGVGSSASTRPPACRRRCSAVPPAEEACRSGLSG